MSRSDELTEEQSMRVATMKTIFSAAASAAQIAGLDDPAIAVVARMADGKFYATSNMPETLTVAVLHGCANNIAIRIESESSGGQ